MKRVLAYGIDILVDNNEYTEIKLERKELYDEVSEVLTNWEMQKMVDDDLYNMLVKIQNKWEEVIAVDTF